MSYWRDRLQAHRGHTGPPRGRGLRLGGVLGLAAAVVATTVSVAGTAPVAQNDVLSTREECQQALTYPSRSTQDMIWLEQCVHALKPPRTSSPTASPTVSPSPSPTPSPTPPAGTGFYKVTGKTIADPAGETFLPRGGEQVFWDATWLPASIVDQYAQSGANAIRILPYYLKATPTGEPPSTLAQIEDQIRRAINAHMLVGIGIDGGTDFHVYLRPEVKAMLFKYEKYLAIHVKGESYEPTDDQWVEDSKEAILAMRDAGYRAPLTVVSRDGGRNLPTLLERGQEVDDIDPLHNMAFDWQAYWGNGNYYQDKYGMTLSEGMDKAAAASIAIQVGLMYHSDPDVDPSQTIPFNELMAQAQRLHMVWLWWDWRMGIDNLSSTGNFADLTVLGRDVVLDNPNSIKNTSVRTAFQNAQSAPPL